MINDKTSPPVAVPVNSGGNQGQPPVQAYYAQPYQDTTVQQGQRYSYPYSYAQPVNQASNPQGRDYSVVETTYLNPPRTYCGPITIILAFLMFWFIGPFVLLFFLCPCDVYPTETYRVREVRRHDQAPRNV